MSLLGSVGESEYSGKNFCFQPCFVLSVLSRGFLLLSNLLCYLSFCVYIKPQPSLSWQNERKNRRQNLCSVATSCFPVERPKIFKGSCYTSSLEQVASCQGFLEHSVCLGKWACMSWVGMEHV